MSVVPDVPSFGSLDELGASVDHLEGLLRIARSHEPLSGRVIQVSYQFPFALMPREEADALEQQGESAVSPGDNTMTVPVYTPGDSDEGSAHASPSETQDVSPRASPLGPSISEQIRKEMPGNTRPSHEPTAPTINYAMSCENDEFLPEPVRDGDPLSLGDDSKHTSPWTLSMHHGYSALHSGVYSLCERYQQTYIGMPTAVRYAINTRNDTRRHVSELTPKERAEIEELLGGLEDRERWAQHYHGKAKLRAQPPNSLPRHGIKYVPVWIDRTSAHGHYDIYCKTSTSTH